MTVLRLPPRPLRMPVNAPKGGESPATLSAMTSAPSRAGSGQLRAHATVTQHERDRSKTVAHEKVVEGSLPGEGAGWAGKVFELTIPGPERSYKSAHIGVIACMPCAPTPVGFAAAYVLIDEIIDEQIQAMAEEVNAHFYDPKRR